MNYYDAMLISCAIALFVLVLMRFREVVLIKQAKAIADMEKAEQEAIPASVVSIFSNESSTFEGAVSLAELNRLRRVDMASRHLLVSSEDNIVQRFSQLERAVKS